MTTEYRDQNGKLLRTDHGTQPAGRPAPTPAPAPAVPAEAAAAAPAKKEK